MDQDSGITASVLATAPGSGAPFEFDHEMIVAVVVVGTDVSEPVAGNVQQAIVDTEDFAGVLAAGAPEPCRESIEVSAVEQAADPVCGSDRRDRLLWVGRDDQQQQSQTRQAGQ